MYSVCTDKIAPQRYLFFIKHRKQSPKIVSITPVLSTKCLGILFAITSISNNFNQNTDMNENEKTIETEQPVNETENTETVANETAIPDANPEEEVKAEVDEPTPEERIAALEAEIEQLKKDALYRAAEFDNYRKRTIQEKADLIKYGSQKAIEAMLPVIDDIERAMQHIDRAEDVASLKEGVALIMEKFQNYLKQQQVTVIPANQGDDFDDSIHEAITMFPAPDPSLKGKIVDCPTKGYKLYDKVLRFAKVVVGQ